MNGTLLRPVEKPWRIFFGIGISIAALAVIAILVWQGIFAHGAPDPTQPNTSKAVAALDIGVLVFREGLECILVLAAITASMTGPKRTHRKPVAAGAGVAFIATLITWFIAIRIVDSLSDNMRALDLQAATGLLAVVVLLIIMNWFFHKIYWGGWIRAHNRRRKHLLENGHGSDLAKRSLLWGLILLGFTSLYREGFEVVLFLQSYHLRFGGGVVLQGDAARTRALGNRRGADVRASTKIAVSQNADHHRRVARRGVAGDGGRASAGDAARALDLDHADSVAGVDHSEMDGALVLRFPNLRNANRARHRGGPGGRLVLCRAKIWRSNAAHQRRTGSRSKSRSRHRGAPATIAAVCSVGTPRCGVRGQRSALSLPTQSTNEKHAFSILVRAGLALLPILTATSAFGGVRHFTFLYEAPTSPPGSIELENTATWAHGANSNDVFVREELEIGITDRFQVGLYPLDWSHQENDGFHYDGGAVELIYNLSNPVIDPVGISLYEEIAAGRQHFESESKLIAQKNFGRWIFDYNATLEAEWEDRHLEEQSRRIPASTRRQLRNFTAALGGRRIPPRIRFAGLARQRKD